MAYSMNRSYRKLNKILTWVVGILLVLAILITVIAIAARPTRVREIGNRLRAMPFEAHHFVPFADGAVYTTSDSRLYHIDRHGKLNWGFENAVSTIQLTAGDNALTCFGGNKLQIISPSGVMLGSVTFEGEIEDVASSDDLICASVHAADNSISLAVLSKTGKILSNLTLLSGQKLVDFGISENGDEVWVLSVEESSRPVYHVDIHSFADEHKLIAALSIDDESIYQVVLNKKGLFLTGTQSLRTYNATNQMVNREIVYGQQMVASDVGEKSITQVFSSAAQPHSAVTVYKNGTLYKKIMLTTAATQILTANSKIYAFTGNELLVYSLEGELSATYALPHPVERYEMCEDSSLVYLIFGQQVSLLQLP